MRAARASAALAVILSLGVGTAARAQGQPAPGAAPPVDAAAEAYDAGVEAHKQRDYARAATLFARADDLAPDPASRLAALKSALLADDPVLGMTLVERASRAGPTTGPLGDAVKEAEARFAARVGRLRIVCTGCAATIDGAAAAIGQDIIVAGGEHAIELSADGRVERRSIRIEAGGALEVSPAPAPAAPKLAPVPRPTSASERAAGPAPRPGDAGAGLSPAWFFAGAGLTAVLGGLTIASGIDVRAREDDFYRAPTDEKAADGQAAETRTYVLGAVTGAAGLATAAVAIFAVRWGRGSTTASVGVSGASADAALGARLRGRF